MQTKESVVWYAVLAELEEVVHDRSCSYGRAVDGLLYKVDLWDSADTAYAVVFKCGSSCLDLAQERAEKFLTKPLKIYAKYMFNHSDIIKHLD